MKTEELVKQFNHPKQVQLKNRIIQVFEIIPDRLTDDVPVILATGWVATPKIFQKNIISLSQLGRRVLCIDLPHGIKTKKMKGYAHTELRKAAALYEVLQAMHIKKVNAVGHSEASIYLSIAGALHPELFSNMVFVNPAGMIGKDNITGLSIRYSKDIFVQMKTNFLKRGMRKIILYTIMRHIIAMAAGPVQTIKQVFAIADAQIDNTLKKIKEHGVKIAVIHSLDDRVYPTSLLQTGVVSNRIDKYYETTGTHNEFYIAPERIMKLVDIAFKELRKKS